MGVNNYPDLNEKALEINHEVESGGAPFPQFRLAEPFEKIRQRTVRHVREAGRVPKVLLLKRGDVKMRTARANFALEFLRLRRFRDHRIGRYAGTKANLVVLCSSDPEYLLIAQEVCAAVQIPVVVAGNPKEQIDALKAAGVERIHPRRE